MEEVLEHPGIVIAGAVVLAIVAFGMAGLLNRATEAVVMSTVMLQW